MEFLRRNFRFIGQIGFLFFFILAIFALVQNMSQIRRFFVGALGTNADIQIQTTNVIGPMQYPWRNLAQGGESKDWSIVPIQKGVSALSPTSIRIDHIYDFYDIVHKEGGSIRMQWSKFDAMLGELAKTGATPYISLSYMPASIALDGDITGVPGRWEDWQFVVTKTIEHVSGDLAIPNVSYEVWNEPDLFGGYTTHGSKNYLTLYEYAARGAKSAQGTEKFFFGGPSTTQLYTNWITDLLKLCIEKDLPLDFLSWHRYSEDIDSYRSDITKIHELLADYPTKKNIALHITEWGHTSAIDPGFDTNFSAIHTMAVSTELVGFIDKAFIFEIQDGKDPNGKVRWGRWGLFDSENNPKPRYSALRFLDRMIGDRVQLQGKGTWVKGIATKNDRSISTLLVNFDPSGQHAEVVPVTWKNIKPGTFDLVIQYFGKTAQTQRVATTSNVLQHRVPMSPNTAVYLELKEN